jgi:hypothetical protein
MILEDHGEHILGAHIGSTNCFRMFCYIDQSRRTSLEMLLKESNQQSGDFMGMFYDTGVCI